MPTRTCLVTGASRGIGSVIAARFADAGHRVALTARGADQLAEVAEKLSGPSLCLPADVTDPAATETVFSTVEETWGPVEVLVLNAGAALNKPLGQVTDEDWRDQLDLNLTAPFWAMRRAIPGMVERGWGRIIVIASIASKIGEPYLSAYTAAKHGVLGLVRSAAVEFARKGITVNAVCPGFVDTPMTDHWVSVNATRTGRTEAEIRKVLADRHPIRRLITSDDVADAVDLCVRSSAINGQAITVDGGAVQT